MSRQKRYTDDVNFVDLKERKYYILENEIMDEYRPIIGMVGYDLYGLYCRMANRQKQNSLHPAMKLITTHLGHERSTISCHNWLLECAELIRIEIGEKGKSNTYYVLDVNPITPKLLRKLEQALQPLETDGVNWARFKAHRLEAVLNWRPLNDLFKVSEKPVEPVDSPPPERSATEIALIDRLVDTFRNNKPKLDIQSAEKMILEYGVEAVAQQLAWLESREVSDNPLKTLRAALKGNWAAPGDKVPLPWIQADFRPFGAVQAPPAPDPLTETWQKIKNELRNQLTQATYSQNIADTRLLSTQDGVWVIQCASLFEQDWLQHRLNGTLTRTITQVMGQEVALQFVVRGHD